MVNHLEELEARRREANKLFTEFEEELTKIELKAKEILSTLEGLKNEIEENK